MKRRPKQQLTQRQCSLAIAAQSFRKSHTWLVHWPSIASTLIEYQEPVTMLRVLTEHAAAVAAEPMETTR